MFDNYALLCGSSVNTEDATKRKIEIMKKLKEQGVNIVSVLECKHTENAYYELQERAPGHEIYDSQSYKSLEGEKDYLIKLKNIAMQGDSFYDKFISDWDKILASGLDVDPSKSGNFFFADGQIHFIDLNFMEVSYEERAAYKYYEMACVLRGGGLAWMCKNVTSEALQLISIIYQKLGLAIIRVNGDIATFVRRVDPYGNFGLREYFGVADDKTR